MPIEDDEPIIQGYAVYGEHPSANMPEGWTKNKDVKGTEQEIQTLVNLAKTGDFAKLDEYIQELEAKYNTAPNGIIYVVLEALLSWSSPGMFIQYGWDRIGDTAFLTIEEAQANAKQRLRNLIKDARINDFTENLEDLSLPVFDYINDNGLDPSATKWEEYIEMCEEADIDWVADVPELVTIRAIKLPFG